MTKGTICKHCAWAKWETTTSGRIKRDVCGKCTFTLTDNDLPKVPPHWAAFFYVAAALNRKGRERGIWPDNMPDCHCFKRKEE